MSAGRPAPAICHPFDCARVMSTGTSGWGRLPGGRSIRMLIRGGFRAYRDYSGGGMTDWGCHTFGGALFALELHETGPVEIIPPDGKEHTQLTYVFANGVRIYHGGGWDGI